ncbi:MAG TPA: MlaD family protein [Solirubrobacterales bacterium]|nr:MlaD family protein [Solirubrobacterales bacterium]
MSADAKQSKRVGAAPKKRRRGKPRVPNWLIAVIFILIFTIGPYLAFTKHIPFTSYGYELKATFTNSANISVKSPVRIAGVEVGKVIKTERDGDATTVTFTVDDAGRPIHKDAFATVKPRIFLEGNFFVDLDPGSPGSPELGSGGTIPISHTSTAVQIDEVLTALQSPVRADLGRLLESYGTALTHEPTAAEDADQLPMVRGLSGGQALNKTFQYGGEAGRYSAQVTQALTGTQKHDLARLVSGSARAFQAFSADQAALQGLIDNFDVFTGALANQSENLKTTVHELAPTLQTAHTSLVSLDRSLPPLRTYAIEFRPAVAELPGLIQASKPWLEQVRPLLSGKEAGGAVKLLAESTPGLAGAAQAGKAVALPQANQLSQCTTKVLVPTSEEPIRDQFSDGGPNYRDFWRLLSDFASASQNFDGNGPYVRAQGGGGPVLLEEFNPTLGNVPQQHQFSRAAEVPLGTQPQLQGQPEARPDVRCETNPVPQINSGPGQVGPTGVKVVPPR